MPFIHSVLSGFPEHYYDQETIIAYLSKYWKKQHYNPARLETFHRNVLVQGRYLACAIEDYEQMSGFQAHNDAWIRVASKLAKNTVESLLEQASLLPKDISLLASTTVTGIAVPTLEARLMNMLPFAATTKRMPFFGLGCLAGVAGINRVADYLLAHPKEAAIFLSVELCSLTLQRKDTDIASLISSGLFGDGGAAVLLVGDKHPLVKNCPLELKKWQSHFFSNSERVMGWDMVDDGFQVVLSPKVARMVKQLPEVLDKFLAEETIDFYVSHPGGPKVLQALEEVLQVPREKLELSWQSLAENGNISSTSVLLILEKTISTLNCSNLSGLMLAMGPGFCAELTLLASTAQVKS